MPSWFCKIWRFIVGLIKAIVKLVAEVLKMIVDYVIDILGHVGSSLFSSPLAWIVGGLLLWAFWPDSDKENSEDRSGGMSDTAVSAATRYSTYGLVG